MNVNDNGYKNSMNIKKYKKVMNIKNKSQKGYKKQK